MCTALSKSGQVESSVPGDAIWISNNLPYIETLKHGHSQQAPKGMVKLLIEEVNLKMDAPIGEGLKDAGL